jgi:hypothetical protein
MFERVKLNALLPVGFFFLAIFHQGQICVACQASYPSLWGRSKAFEKAIGDGDYFIAQYELKNGQEGIIKLETDGFSLSDLSKTAFKHEHHGYTLDYIYQDKAAQLLFCATVQVAKEIQDVSMISSVQVRFVSTHRISFNRNAGKPVFFKDPKDHHSINPLDSRIYRTEYSDDYLNRNRRTLIKYSANN